MGKVYFFLKFKNLKVDGVNWGVLGNRFNGLDFGGFSILLRFLDLVIEYSYIEVY